MWRKLWMNNYDIAGGKDIATATKIYAGNDIVPNNKITIKVL